MLGPSQDSSLSPASPEILLSVQIEDSAKGTNVFSLEDVERLEALYANGQAVKAIYECRILALSVLPGHADRLGSYLAKQKHRFQNEDVHAEEYVFNLGTPENTNAAEVLVWCAKWTLGYPEPRTTGIFKGQTQQTHIVRTREDFAHNAFIALRRMAPSASLASTQTLLQNAEPITRRALLDKHRKAWPSLETDLKDGNNGLEKARIKHGLYDEAKVILWGNENGRLQQNTLNISDVWPHSNSTIHNKMSK